MCDEAFHWVEKQRENSENCCLALVPMCLLLAAWWPLTSKIAFESGASFANKRDINDIYKEVPIGSTSRIAHLSRTTQKLVHIKTWIYKSQEKSPQPRNGMLRIRTEVGHWTIFTGVVTPILITHVYTSCIYHLHGYGCSCRSVSSSPQWGPNPMDASALAASSNNSEQHMTTFYMASAKEHLLYVHHW